MSDHTFLFKEGIWTAEGFFYDESDSKIPAKGRSEITHTEKFWINESRMTLLEGNKAEIENRYEVIPFDEYSTCTIWKSFNPALGALHGTFVIIEDSLLSFFSSEKDNYTGYEYLLKLSNMVYKNRGCLFKGETKVSSWAMTLYKFE